MYLSKIELLGFKSFAHRVKISFDKGLTAIVGPNGCGKTNVVDAIRWVLGEQRTSLLRSAKMENIIFNGSKNLKPLSLTEVSITIENTRNVLPTEYTEVTVTRRLYRNGDSDYLLNQVPCRLKDILDLFTDTGMGSDAYSVIELKMIEEIISNKSEERLKLFEEAAGITRYKQRRKQTFKQLESASRDLSRVDDVVTEVEKKVRNLKLQVKKAEKLRELKQEIKELDLLLGGLALHEQLEKLEPLKKQIDREDTLCHKLAAAIALSDSNLQEAELLQIRREEELSTAQKQLNTGSAIIHDIEKKILQHEEQRKGLEAALLKNRSTLQEKQRYILELEERNTGLFKEKKPVEEACALRLEEYRNLASEQLRLDTELQKGRSQIAEQRKEVSETEKRLSALFLRKNSLENRKEHLGTSLQRSEKTKTATLMQIEESRRTRSLAEEKITLQKARIDQAREEESRLKQQLEELAGFIQFRREELLSLKAQRETIHNQIVLADAVLENFEGLPQGIAFLEKQKAPGTAPGCLADLIALDPAHRKAVHAALGEALGYYITGTITEAKQSMELLLRSKKGKLHFLVLDLIRKLPENGTPGFRNATSILSLVHFPEKLSSAMQLLLGNHYLVDNLETAEKLSREHPESVFVTTAGEKFNAKGVLYGGSPHSDEGLRLGKKAERDTLLKKEHELQERTGEMESALLRLRWELDAVSEKVKEVKTDALQQELNQLEKQLARIEAEESSRRDTIGRAEQETAETIALLLQLDNEITDLSPDVGVHEEKLRQLRTAAMLAQEKLTEIENRYHRLNIDVQERQNIHRDKQLELEKLLFSINATAQTQRSVREDIRRLEEEAVTIMEKLAETEKIVSGLKTELENLLVDAAGAQESLGKLETRCREQQAANHDARNALRELRRKHDISREMVGELQNEQLRAEQHLDHLMTAIRVRYGCELDTANPSTPPADFDRASAENRLDTLQRQREQFGAVNELALEEYAVEKERLDFLIAQKEDLLSAETQLRNTIEEINKTALRKFEETYSAVRKNFIAIFHELFDPEDEVDLLCSSTEDPLDAHIEIVAKPRGKKPLSIEQLSGGEKALTALSLLFAIYLVKPSPFCILDEVDAPLDDANVGRFIKLLKKFENNTQFIIVTHNKKSMASCQALYGVTMEEEGVSKLIPVRLEKSDR
ncbi:MAG: chromosome segregation protein SMC [Chlorobi bacterium]|nr:chromosome segregation protein SMC [Chlorobiota bacterium]